MTPAKAERPDQGGGYSRFDRPVSTPDTVGAAATQHVLRAEIYDTHVHGLKHFWDSENNFLTRLQEQVAETKQQRSA